MKFGSLFTGIGGFDLAFERAGMECLWQVEKDADCNRVLSATFQNVKRYSDVTQVNTKELEPVDLICFGWPCQDLSVAGLRAGISGERSGLFTEAVRIIAELRPKWFVAENVPGLHSSYTPIDAPPSNVEIGSEWEVEEDSDFETVLTSLDELGYCVAGRIIDAQYLGVAQRRERVFLVGSLGTTSSIEILFEPESVFRDSAPRREAWPGTPEVSVRRAQTSSNDWGVRTDGSTGTLDGSGSGSGSAGDAVIAGSIQSHAKKHGHAMTAQQAAESNHLIAGPVNRNPGFKGWASDDESLVAVALCAHAGLHDSGGQQTLVTHALRSGGADASEDGTGRGTPIVVAAPLRGGEAGGSTHGKQSGSDRATLIAFSSKDHGADAGEISPTLRSQNFRDSHINGGGQVAVAFEPRYYTRDNATGGAPDEVVGIINAHKAGDSAPVVFESRVARNGRRAPSDIVPPLKAESGQTGKGDSAPLIAFDHCLQGSERSFIHRKNEKAQLQGNRPDSVAGNVGVRRLTPRECERLQSFPDDFTRWDADGKEISDSARYRMLGNAVAVPVAEWIGKRIKLTG